MRAKVTVTLKREVLDPQGEAVRRSLAAVGLTGVGEVRVGKVIELDLPPEMLPAEAQVAVERAADKLLANPVIEDWKVEIAPTEVPPQ